MNIRVLAGALTLSTAQGYAALSGAADTKPSVVVYKSPTCGCCSKWIEHMKANGFDVKSTDMDDVGTVKKQYGVPVDSQSCHTALVEGYVLEGHVPATAVKKMLKDKPKVVGLAVPGMPVGSPGMEVPSGQVEPYNVVSFDKAGKTAVFEKH